MKWLFNIFKRHNKTKGKCTTCKFNKEERCVVGGQLAVRGVYTERGGYVMCYEGELWEKKKW